METETKFVKPSLKGSTLCLLRAQFPIQNLGKCFSRLNLGKTVFKRQIWVKQFLKDKFGRGHLDLVLPLPALPHALHQVHLGLLKAE